jgi:hypothetical protein
MAELNESQQFKVAHIDFAKILQGAKKYDDIEQAIAKSIAELKAQGMERIGFVSGPINNSKDPDPRVKREIMMRNEENMRQEIIRLAEEHGFPVFGSTNIFDVVWKQLEETKLDPEKRPMTKLFNRILGNGVTDIFMIKGWRDAGGALKEYEFSELNGINIHDEDPQQPLPPTQP